MLKKYIVGFLALMMVLSGCQFLGGEEIDGDNSGEGVSNVSIEEKVEKKEDEFVSEFEGLLNDVVLVGESGVFDLEGRDDVSVRKLKGLTGSDYDYRVLAQSVDEPELVYLIEDVRGIGEMVYNFYEVDLKRETVKKFFSESLKRDGLQLVGMQKGKLIIVKMDREVSYAPCSSLWTLNGESEYFILNPSIENPVLKSYLVPEFKRGEERVKTDLCVKELGN